MISSKDSASKRPLAKPRCKVQVVMAAPEMKDSFSDNTRGKKLNSEDLPDGWERWSLPRKGNCSRRDTVIISPWGRKFDRKGKLLKYLKGSQRCVDLSLEHISIKPSKSSPMFAVRSLTATSKSEPGDRRVRKINKKLMLKSCDKMTTLRRIPDTTVFSGFSSNPRTVRDRRTNLSILKDFNHNHEDDFFEHVDKSSMPSKFLLNSSSSSSDGSSPALSRKSSPASFLNTLTREDTPLQLRGILHQNKDDAVESVNSFGHISFINRKLKKPRVAMKNLFQSRSCGNMTASKSNKIRVEEVLQTALSGLDTTDPHGHGRDDLSDVEPYFTDDETNDD